MAKILIMDDEPGLRNVVFNMLRPLGQQLFLAEDGKQAIEIGRREIPDMALLDMRVPDMDGLEVMVELKKINPNVKCIMLSGFGDVETAVNSIKQGAFDYLSKPFKIDEVLKVVNKAMHSVGTSVNQPAVGSNTASAGIKIVGTPNIAGAASATASSVPAAPIKSSQKGIPLPVMISAAVLSAAVIGFAIFKLGFGGSEGKQFSIPYNNATGMSWVKNNLWVCDWVMGNIYQHNNDSKLSIVSVYKTTNLQPTGVAYDGEFLWSCNSSEKRIYKHSIDSSLTVQAIYSLPNVSPAALYFDGANLWLIDSDNAKIYKHKMDQSLSVVGVFDSPAVNPCGMFKKDEFFYIGDYKTGKVYKVSSTDFSVREVFGLPGFKDGKYKLASICWDGNAIWVSADGMGKIFQFSFSDLKVIKF